MRFVFPEIHELFDTTKGGVPTLVIESRSLYLRLLSDLKQQSEGFDGKAVLSDNGKTLEISKYAELIYDFIALELNQKSLLTKLVAAMEKQAYAAEHFLQTRQLLAALEQYVETLAFDFPCDIVASKLNIGALLKGIGIEIRDENNDQLERLLDYLQLVREFDRDKLFITVNMRSYFEDQDMDMFLDTVLAHGYHLLMIENKAYPMLKNENRLTIDEDLCEF